MCAPPHPHLPRLKLTEHLQGRLIDLGFESLFVHRCYIVLLLFFFLFHFCFSLSNFNFKYVRSHIIMPCKFEVDFSKIDSLLDIPSIVLINHHLPASQQHRWRLLFSTQIHGESFSAFIHQITNQGPVVIVVRDTSGHVFGGFASMSWTIKSHFVGEYILYILSL